MSENILNQQEQKIFIEEIKKEYEYFITNNLCIFMIEDKNNVNHSFFKDIDIYLKRNNTKAILFYIDNKENKRIGLILEKELTTYKIYLSDGVKENKIASSIDVNECIKKSFKEFNKVLKKENLNQHLIEKKIKEFE